MIDSIFLSLSDRQFAEKPRSKRELLCSLLVSTTIRFEGSKTIFNHERIIRGKEQLTTHLIRIKSDEE